MAIEKRETSEHKRQPVWFIVFCFMVLAGFVGLIAAGYLRITSGTITNGSKCPEFQLTTFERKTYKTTDISDSVVVVNFWALWCQACKEETTELEEAWQKYRDGGKVLFLGVDFMDTETQALQYLSTNPVSYPNGPDAGGRISAAFRVRGVPETYIFDRDGVLVYSLKGPISSSDNITQIIDPLLIGE